MTSPNYGKFLESCSGFSLGAFDVRDDVEEPLSEGELLAIALRKQRENIEANADQDENVWNDAVGSQERRALLSSVKDNLVVLSSDDKLYNLLNHSVIDSCGSSSASAKPSVDEVSNEQLVSSVRMCVDQMARLASQDSSNPTQPSPTFILDSILRIPVSSLQ